MSLYLIIVIIVHFGCSLSEVLEIVLLLKTHDSKVIVISWVINADQLYYNHTDPVHAYYPRF